MVKSLKSIGKRLGNGSNYSIIIKNMKKANFVLFVVFFIAIVAWIGVFTWDYFANQKEMPLPPSPVDDESSLANPASVFCEEQGGQIKMYELEAGQAGYCVFEDGRVCEEWALFRDGECNIPEE